MGFFSAIGKLVMIGIVIVAVFIFLSEGGFDFSQMFGGPQSGPGSSSRRETTPPKDSDGDGLTDEQERSIGTDTSSVHNPPKQP